jgi:hypothetical protein
LQNSRPIKDAVQWIPSQKKQDGWVRYYLREELPSTEITAWVGLAYETTVSARVFSDNLQQEKIIIEELKAIHSTLSTRQNLNGSWSSYPMSFPSLIEPMRPRGSYATTLATMFFIHLNKPTHYKTIVDQETLGSQLDKGVR